MSDNAAQVLPHSEETERAVLATALLRPDLIPQLLAKIPTPAVFYVERHRLTWKAMLQLVDAGVELDLLSIRDRLTADGTFEQVGGMAFLAGLDLDLPDLGRWETYAGIIVERYRRRLTLQLAPTLAKVADPSEDLQRALSQVQAGLDRITGLGPDAGTAETMAEMAEAALPPLPGDEPPSLPMPSTDLDRFHYLSPGLWTVAGNTNHGKSAFALWVVNHVAHTLGRRVLHFSLEMSGPEVWQRLYAMRAGIPFLDIFEGNVTDSQRARVEEEKSHVLELNTWRLDPNFGHTWRSVVAEIRRAHTESPLDLVVVDYLGQLSGLGSTSSDKNVALGAATSAFHDVGCELGFTVMCLAQTSRAFVRRGGYNPQKSDLRDCGEIENNSKSITFVSQPALFARDQLSQGEELPADVNEREFIVHHRKGRNTVPWADVELWFDGATMQFRSVDNVHAEPAGQNLLGW